MFVGTDIVEVERIKAAILRTEYLFLNRILTESERAKIDQDDFERISGFWAAKESLVKAIGVGFRDGILFHHAEISHNQYGAPYFLFNGRLKEIIEARGIAQISLSISHCRTHAIAVTIIA